MVFLSDDFNNDTLGSQWTFIDPLGGGNYTLTGTADAFLELFVPEGTSHSPGKRGNKTVRAVQAATDEDFEVEVKFASEPSEKYQFQGIVIEQDAANWLRFGHLHDGSVLTVFVGSTIEGNSTNSLIEVPVSPGAAPYLRVTRQGEQWTLQYSADGATWNNAGSITQALTVNEIGTFAANHGIGGSIPAFTAQVDYFFNTASPISPEDESSTHNDDHPPNQAPVANDDFVTTNYETALSGDVLADNGNGADSDPDGDPILIAEVNGDSADIGKEITLASGALLTLNADGTFNYDPNGQFADLNAGENTTDSFNYSIEDGKGETAAAIVTVTLTNPDNNTSTSTFTSDDFNNDTLGSQWTFIDPLGGGNYTLTGTADAFLELFVPEGTSHSPGKRGNKTVRAVQAATDEDFEVEVKFASEPSEKYQFQGIVIEQDDANWLRFGHLHDGSVLTVFVGSTIEGNSTNSLIEVPVSPRAAPYLRVTRQGEQWTLQYSADGATWNNAGSITQALTVNEIGTFAANHGIGGSIPAFTAQVDYFFNTASPISPEDGGSTHNDDHPPNQAPVANDDTVVVPINTATELNLLDNDSDSDGSLDPASLTLTSNPNQGTVAVDNITGFVTYTPNTDFLGSDSFSYTVADDQGAVSESALVSLSVEETSDTTNQPPVANDDTAVVEVNTVTTLDVLANDTDSDGNLDPTSVAIVDAPSNGSVTVDAATGQVTYIPNTDFIGSDNFSYTVADDQDTVSNLANVDLAVEAAPTNQGDGPAIDVWYGLDQTFGQIGQPQNWVNILGHVDDPDGVSSLTYSLNGEPEVALTIDQGFRINKTGDFNADIAYADLDGSSTDDIVVLTATDDLGNVSTQTVTIDYEAGNVWPQTYSIDWSTTSNILDVAQVVDGLWAIEGDTVRTVEPGYDRLIGIGDISWQDFEVTVPITINGGINSKGAVGVLMRWHGHNDDSLSGRQPLAGVAPFGALGWAQDGDLIIKKEGGATNPGKTLQPDLTYNFKMRVETTDTGSLYSLKAWELGQSEPMGWDVETSEGLSDLDSGSLFLVAHRQDATFGDVNITPI